MLQAQLRVNQMTLRSPGTRLYLMRPMTPQNRKSQVQLTSSISKSHNRNQMTAHFATLPIWECCRLCGHRLGCNSPCRPFKKNSAVSSSLMFQVPHWTSDKALEYPLWFLRAPSPPVRCCLPAPFLLSVCVVSLCPCLVLPLLLCLLSSCVDVSYFLGLVCDYLSLFVFGRLSCDLSCCSGALVSCLCDEFVFHCLVLLSHSGLLRFPPPSLCFCFSGLGGLSVLGCVLVGPFFWFCFGFIG